MQLQDGQYSEPVVDHEVIALRGFTCLTRIAGPLFKLIDRPWKVRQILSLENTL
jgi:hypothetical protein